MKERMLTILVPIKDSDAVEVATLPAVSPDNINVIYKYNDVYERVWLNPDTGQYEYHEVIDREFPYIGHPLEIFDFTCDKTRMGPAAVISAQGVMWYAEKDNNGEDITLEDKWIEYGQQCRVSFNGENFYLKQIPTANKDNEDARYRYDIDFVSEYVVLEQVYLYDVVQPYVTEKPVSESAVFSFYGDVNDLAKRINVSLVRSGLANYVRKYVNYPYSPQAGFVPYLTYEQWNLVLINSNALLRTVFGRRSDILRFISEIYKPMGGDYSRYLSTYIYENDNGEYVQNGYRVTIGKDKYGNLQSSEEKQMTFDNAYIHEALNQIKDIFGLQYYITKEKDAGGVFTGNILIVIGDCEHDFADINQSGTDYVRDADGIPTTEHPFDYGVDDALLSKEKTNTTEQIITRITGVGSTENIPWYYPNPTADGWIKPVFKTNGSVQQIDIDYPKDEGSTTADSVLYEKFLKNRLGDVLQYGVRKNVLLEDSYKNNSLSGNTTAGTFQMVYVLDVKSGYTDPKFVFKLSFLKDSQLLKYAVRLRDNTASSVVGEYDSSETYATPTTFQQAFIDSDGSVPIPLTAGHVYYLSFGIWLDGGTPVSNRYDYDGYHYNGRYAGYTTDYNQYYPQLSQISRHVHIREDFYSEDGLVEVGSLFATYYTNNQHNIVIGYSVNGTPQTAFSPIPKIEGKRYKDKTTGVIYQCTNADAASETGFVANPSMDYAEWIDTFMRFTLYIWSVDGEWYKKSKKVNLADYGLTLGSTGSHNLDITDTIEFQRLRYITPCSNLMPEAYIKSDGERRYYDAIQYPRYGTADPVIGEITITSQRNLVVNPLYQKDNMTHYDFENVIMPSQPKEYIKEFEDIKPTIKGQTNYAAVFFESEPDDWDEIYKDYYIKTIDGDFVPAESVWDAGAKYYKEVRIDVVEMFAYDELDDDEVWENNDNGNVSGEYKHPYFFAKLRPLGFNIFDLALQEDMVLSMTTGHCGACNFKIGVDENTGKNPVQIWEYNVYEGADWNSKVLKYEAGSLRRYVDTTNLYYDTDGTSIGYKHVDSFFARFGFLAFPNSSYSSPTYSAASVAAGEVGSLKQDNKTHFDGDVVVKGKFIPSQQDTSENYVWVALFKDTDTYGTIMPSAKPDYADDTYSVYIRPEAAADGDDESADKFVLVNIRMPQRYLRSAEHELSKELVKYMYDNNYQKFNFTINFSRIFVAQNPDIDNVLNENSVVYVNFNRSVYRQYVQRYTYKMSKDAVLPDIDISMNEELSVTRTKREREALEKTNAASDVTRRISRKVDMSNNNIMRRTVSKSDDSIVSGNIVSRDAMTSFGELKLSSVDAKENIRQTAALRQSTSNFIDAANDFNVGVVDRLKQIRLTVEKRLLPVADQVEINSSCVGTARYHFEPAVFRANTESKMWLDADGNDQTFSSITCPTDQGMTDITWSEFNFS